jgi:hypothetical protein
MLGYKVDVSTWGLSPGCQQQGTHRPPLSRLRGDPLPCTHQLLSEPRCVAMETAWQRLATRLELRTWSAAVVSPAVTWVSFPSAPVSAQPRWLCHLCPRHTAATPGAHARGKQVPHSRACPLVEPGVGGTRLARVSPLGDVVVTGPQRRGQDASGRDVVSA